MSSHRLPAVRVTPDTIGKGYRAAHADWRLWPATHRALCETYYLTSFPEADQQYMLAGLQQYHTAFESDYSEQLVDLAHLDAAAAHEIRYQALRGRVFRRACAALSTCILNVALERPERILDRHARGKKIGKNTTRRERQDATTEAEPVLPNSSTVGNIFAQSAEFARLRRLAAAR